MFVGSISFYLARTALIEAQGQKLLAVVSNQKNNLLVVVNGWSEQVNLIASRTQLRAIFVQHLASPSPDHISDMQKILEDAVVAVRSIESLKLCDPEGNIVISVGESARGDRDCRDFLEASQSKTNVRTLWMTEDGMLHALVTGSVTMDGTLVGVLYATMNVQEIKNIVENYDGLGETGETVIAERTGDGNARFLTSLRYDSNKGLKRVVEMGRTDVPITQALLKKEDALVDVETVDYRGQKVLAATAYIPQLDWGMVSKIDRREAVESVETFFVRLSQTVLVIFVLIALWSLRNAKRYAELIAKDKRAALDLSEKQFQVAIESAAVGVALVGTDGRWLKVNKALCDIVGYTEEELLAIDFQTITHPDDLDSDPELLQQTLAGEIDNYTMEKRYIRKDGSVVWILLAVGLVRDAAGEPAYFVSQILDIDERKKILAELEAAQKFTDLVLDTIPDFVFVKDEDFKIVRANKAFMKLYPPDMQDKIIGYTTVENYSEAESDLFLKNDRVAFEKGISQTYEDLELYDGVTINIDTTKVRFSDASGKKYILGFSRNVSELQEAKRTLEEKVEQRTVELQEKSKLLDTIIENLPLTLFAKDVKDDYQIGKISKKKLMG